MSSIQGANSPEKVLKPMGMAFWTAVESESDIDTSSDWIEIHWVPWRCWSQVGL